MIKMRMKFRLRSLLMRFRLRSRVMSYRMFLYLKQNNTGKNAKATIETSITNKHDWRNDILEKIEAFKTEVGLTPIKMAG